MRRTGVDVFDAFPLGVGMEMDETGANDAFVASPQAEGDENDENRPHNTPAIVGPPPKKPLASAPKSGARHTVRASVHDAATPRMSRMKMTKEEREAASEAKALCDGLTPQVPMRP